MALRFYLMNNRGWKLWWLEALKPRLYRLKSKRELILHRYSHRFHHSTFCTDKKKKRLARFWFYPIDRVNLHPQHFLFHFLYFNWFIEGNIDITWISSNGISLPLHSGKLSFKLLVRSEMANKTFKSSKEFEKKMCPTLWIWVEQIWVWLEQIIDSPTQLFEYSTND